MTFDSFYIIAAIAAAVSFASAFRQQKQYNTASRKSTMTRGLDPSEPVYWRRGK